VWVVRFPDHVKDDIVREVDGRERYVGMVFTCPLMDGVRISSRSYPTARKWRKACVRHVAEVHGQVLEDSGFSAKEILAFIPEGALPVVNAPMKEVPTTPGGGGP
jgi:hypothetical protein